MSSRLKDSSELETPLNKDAYKFDLFEVIEPQKDQPHEDARSSTRYNRKAIFFQILCSFFSVLILSLRKSIPQISSSQILFERSPINIVLVFLYLYKKGKINELKDGFRPKMLLISLLQCSAAAASLISVMSLNISDHTIINSSSTIFGGVLSAIFLGDPYYNSEKILGAVGMIGVMFIVRPPWLFGHEAAQPTQEGAESIMRYIAGFIALYSAFAFALCSLIIKSFQPKLDPFVLLFYMNIGMFLIFGAQTIIFGPFVSLTFSEFITITLVGVIFLLAIYTVIIAVQLEKLSVLGVVDYSRLLFSLVTDLFFFGDIPSFTTVIGASLVIGSCVYLITTKK